MRVGFFAFHPRTMWRRGGGEHQLRETKEALEELGVTVELFDIWEPRKDFDLFHIFGSTYQLADFVETVAGLEVPSVVSTIIYTTKPSLLFGVARWADRLMPVPTVYTFRRRIYDSATRLIATSQAERSQIAKNFKVRLEKIDVVPNGVDVSLGQADRGLFRERFGLSEFVLMVGRVSERKGQLRLLRAVESLRREEDDLGDLQVVFVGPEDPKDAEYCRRFRRAVLERDWAHYVGEIGDRALLASAYAGAAVHVLPSKSESAGLASMEAGMAGTRVVAVEGRPVREHLGSEAFYARSARSRDVQRAVQRALRSRNGSELQRRLGGGFTWKDVGKLVHRSYERALNQR